MTPPPIPNIPPVTPPALPQTTESSGVTKRNRLHPQPLAAFIILTITLLIVPVKTAGEGHMHYYFCPELIANPNFSLLRFRGLSAFFNAVLFASCLIGLGLNAIPAVRKLQQANTGNTLLKPMVKAANTLLLTVIIFFSVFCVASNHSEWRWGMWFYHGTYFITFVIGIVAILTMYLKSKKKRSFTPALLCVSAFFLYYLEPVVHTYGYRSTGADINHHMWHCDKYTLFNVLFLIVPFLSAILLMIRNSVQTSAIAAVLLIIPVILLQCKVSDEEWAMGLMLDVLDAFLIFAIAIRNYIVAMPTVKSTEG